MNAAQASARAAARGERPSEDNESTTPKPAPAFAAVVHLLREVWALAHDHLLLVVLEAQRAGRNITRMIFAGVVAAVLLVTAWLALVASAMFWIVAADAPWARAFLAVGLLHAAISIALIAWIRRLGANTMFSATLRQLRPGGKAQGDEA
jgi:uncharacterized membrane protein YqjE